MKGHEFHCCNCNGTNIQVCLPGWYRAETLEHVECDVEAEALSYFCEDCGDTVTVIVTTDLGKYTDSGRW